MSLINKIYDTLFFAQERVGLDGKTFILYKFRTMENGREEERASLQASHGVDKFGHVIDDPRVTWLGKYSRKYTIDELPQIWNVIMGDMGWTGPRPLSLEDHYSLPENQRKLREKFKPGFLPIHLIADYFNIRTVEDTRASDANYNIQRKINPHVNREYFFRAFETIVKLAKESFRMNIYKWSNSMPYI